jgi:2-polyprenyl-6-methoxyphenol hydroxylase-like FAD-dependent oxidoreductase
MQCDGAPYWFAHRGDFRTVLPEAVRIAAPDATRVGVPCIGRAGVPCTGFEPTDDAVTLHLADGECVAIDVLPAADGVHAAIRRPMFGGSKGSGLGAVHTGSAPLPYFDRTMLIRLTLKGTIGGVPLAIRLPLFAGMIDDSLCS